MGRVLGGIGSVAGSALGQVGGKIGGTGKGQQGGVGGGMVDMANLAAQVIFSSTGSVAKGIFGAGTAGIAAAKSSFTIALPAVQSSLAGGLSAAISPSCTTAGPEQYLASMGGSSPLASSMQKVLQSVRDPGLNIAGHLADFNKTLEAPDTKIQFDLQQANSVYQRFQKVSSETEKRLSDTLSEMLKHIGG